MIGAWQVWQSVSEALGCALRHTPSSLTLPRVLVRNPPDACGSSRLDGARSISILDTNTRCGAGHVLRPIALPLVTGTKVSAVAPSSPGLFVAKGLRSSGTLSRRSVDMTTRGERGGIAAKMQALLHHLHETSLHHTALL